jgi:hypothetical protein
MSWEHRPAWIGTAFNVEHVARNAGWRVNRLRLTRQEADELRAYTGHDDRLIGYPVEIKHTAA